MRRILALGGMLAMLSLLPTPTPAQAGEMWVYIALPTWLGNCPKGGNVTGVYATVGDTWATPAKGDWGDDIVWAKVKPYAGWPQNAVTSKAYCSRPWYKGGPYWGPESQNYIVPKRHGQTFWVGPAGQRNN